MENEKENGVPSEDRDHSDYIFPYFNTSIFIRFVECDPGESLNEIMEAIYKAVPARQTSSIYMELWDPIAFEEYFPIARKKLKGPFGFKKPSGFYQFVLTDEIGPEHQIGIKFDSKYKEPLKHEIFHMICAEYVGFEVWTMMGKMTHMHPKQRVIDPWEMCAYLAGDFYKYEEKFLKLMESVL